MIWDNSVVQWSSSGCHNSRVFSQDGVIFVECSCSRLGFITVNAAGGRGGTYEELSTQPTTLVTTGTDKWTTGMNVLSAWFNSTRSELEHGQLTRRTANSVFMFFFTFLLNDRAEHISCSQ